MVGDVGAGAIPGQKHSIEIGVLGDPRVGGGGGDEVEGDVFGAGGVLEDGEDGRDGAAEVGGVEGHGHVDRIGVGGGRGEGGAASRVVEFGGFPEPRGGGSGSGIGICWWCDEEEEDWYQECG